MRYIDCQYKNGDCSDCSFSKNGRDCHKFPINKLAYLRTTTHLTQSQLSKASGVNQRTISKLECEILQLCNMRLKTAIALADVLSVKDLRDLL